MSVHYPAGPVTPAGHYHLVAGEIPMMWLESYDKSVRFDLMGGRAIPDRTRPECVQLPRDGIKGLIPPWETIDQKGATEDGVTFIDALYGPMEVTLQVLCYGRDRKHLRKVIRDLIGSIDVKQTSKLGFWTHDAGHWWTNLRWFKTAPESISGAGRLVQPLTLVLRADDGFWRTFDSSDIFTPAYEAMTDSFTYTAGSAEADTLGDNWPLYYSSSATEGYLAANGSQAYWVDDPDVFINNTRRVVAGPYVDFNTATDNQVASIVFGSFQEFGFPQGAENHIWLRMGREADGTWDGNGIRVSIGLFDLRLSRFNNFVETVMRTQLKPIPPFPGEKFTLIAGIEGNPRRFQVQRNGLPLLDHIESGTGSELGSDYRGVGFGMQAGAAIFTQATPGSIRKISAGDNVTVSQEGFVRRVNPGDQPMYDTYTVFGPGTFRFWLGPGAGAEDYVEFGPLLDNQVVFIDTDPRRRVVQDLTSVPPTPQQLNIFQQAINGFLQFAGGSNVPLIRSIQSAFGIAPPQGNLYSLLSGRFSDVAAIPAKSPGAAAAVYRVKVSIDNGTAASKIIVSGTPKRRFPI